MKKTITLLLGLIATLGLSVTSYAEVPVIPENTSLTTISSKVMPRMSYEDKRRTISGKGSWTSSVYTCNVGDYFGGGIDAFVTLSGKVQFSTTGTGSWKTLATKSLYGYESVSVQVEQKGYYRFVLTNNSSSSVSAECYVMID